MIRVWLAHEDLHVSLFLGMWQDAEESEVDEREAWGTLLADVVHHIARGLNQSHTFPEPDTVRRIREAFLEALNAKDKQRTGGYVDS
jgi:predicted secreted Zn-dependent protease